MFIRLKSVVVLELNLVHAQEVCIIHIKKHEVQVFFYMCTQQKCTCDKIILDVVVIYPSTIYYNQNAFSPTDTIQDYIS